MMRLEANSTGKLNGVTRLATSLVVPMRTYAQKRAFPVVTGEVELVAPGSVGAGTTGGGPLRQGHLGRSPYVAATDFYLGIRSTQVTLSRSRKSNAYFLLG